MMGIDLEHIHIESKQERFRYHPCTRQRNHFIDFFCIIMKNNNKISLTQVVHFLARAEPPLVLILSRFVEEHEHLDFAYVSQIRGNAGRICYMSPLQL